MGNFIPVMMRFRAEGDLHQKLKIAAKANKNTMNGEIIERLERSFFEKELKDIVREAVRESCPQIVPTILDRSGDWRYDGFGG